ncbi:hypothetical protein AB3N59_03900 [Leptospira sp. WS92.C1]
MDDIHKGYDRLKSLGLIFRSEPTMVETGIETLLEDTCENLIQIFQVV